MNNKAELKARIISGKRIDTKEALALFDWDLLELGYLGNLRRQQAFPAEKVGFIIDRIINFTNMCEAACNFCAFHARGNRIPAYEMTAGEILQKVGELVATGGTQVMLQGGLHPEYSFDKYVELVRLVKSRFPDIWLHSFSPSELVHIARKNRMSLSDVVGHLQSAGLDSVPGASDLLVDHVRQRVSPRKATLSDWIDVMDVLSQHGMKSSATMTYGMGETLADRVEHLRVIREVQDRTGILQAFIPWSFSPAMTRMEDIVPATGIEYLKIVAIGRIFLDNITHIQAGWLTEGLKLAQIALTMGANDMGGVLTEEIVVKATGVETHTHQGEMIDIIRNAGKEPVQRDSLYRVIRTF